jgi:hypothetical protein
VQTDGDVSQVYRSKVVPVRLAMFVLGEPIAIDSGTRSLFSLRWLEQEVERDEQRVSNPVILHMRSYAFLRFRLSDFHYLTLKQYAILIRLHS